MMSGKVWLVGAGPGDAELLTLKAEKVLKEAEVLVYDHLAGKDILARYGEGKELIPVGKTAGHHSVVQEEINQILVREAKRGKKVVRLKGGDPFLFGRGGEEIEALVKEQIPFEVVPGVTSALAVPAYNGIPVTHRNYASSLHIITGHAKRGQETSINYQALVALGGTLVFLMGVTALEKIMTGLLEAGMDEHMPAAILQEGTTARQRKVVATVATLAAEANKAQIKAPAVIVVGEVCSLSDTFGWYEKLPLMGMRILLTRPKELISSTAERLRGKGADVLEIPAIETVPLENALRDVAEQLSSYDWIVFTSQVGVRIFFEALQKEKKDIRCLFHARFAVIGEGTRAALEKYGIYADVMPEVYDGESLGRALAEQDIGGRKILIPRAREGNQNLVPILEEAGADVTDLPVYQTEYRKFLNGLIENEITKGRVDCVVFTSSSTVRGFARNAGEIDFTKIIAACIGRKTADTATSYGMQCRISEHATIDSLLELIERIRKND